MQRTQRRSARQRSYHPIVEENRVHLDLYRPWSDGYAAMQALESAVRGSGLDLTIFELVKTRASQINGCAFCIDMHTKDARANGETEQRLYALSAWRETPFFTNRERAALEYTEAVTRVGDTHVPDDVYARVAALFDEDEMVALTFAVVVINAWNRLAISFRVPPGSYQPAQTATA
jgi:AhpD family alkylhydroperoxidase